MHLNIPNFFGKNISFEKIITDNFSECFVSKDKPISYFLTKKSESYFLTGQTFISQIDVSSQVIKSGYEYLTYLLNPNFNDSFFQEFIDHNTISFTQQFYVGDKVSVINLIHNFEEKPKNISSQEIFINVFGKKTLSSDYDLVSDFDYSIFESAEKVLSNYNKTFPNLNIDFDIKQLYFNQNPNIYHIISFFFEQHILHSSWMNKNQEYKIFKDFVKNSRKPLILKQDKINYFELHKEFYSNKYFYDCLFGDNVFMFSTNMNWGSNFPENMVSCCIYENFLIDNKKHFKVVFTGTDDCDLCLIFNYDVFSSKSQFIDFILKNNGVIYYDLIQELKDKSIDCFS